MVILSWKEIIQKMKTFQNFNVKKSCWPFDSTFSNSHIDEYNVYDLKFKLQIKLNQKWTLLDHINFLLHSILTQILFAADEIYLNSRTFLWPHELEQVLALSGARLSVVRENLEVALRLVNICWMFWMN